MTRRRLCPTTSSESGFSDAEAPTTEDDDDGNDDDDDVSIEVNKSKANPICVDNEMSASTVTIKAPDEPTPDILPSDVLPTPSTIPVFIPSLDYVTGVPPELLPPIFPSEDPISRLGLGIGGAEQGSEENSVAENYEELYSKLIASTARSAALANRLAEIHR